MSNPNHGLTITAVSKSFAGAEILRDVNLTAQAGEFLTILGPSGCGKSTLLRIVAGLENPDTGAISIRGRDVTSLRPSARDVAMVFQSYALYPHFTAAKNISLPLELRKLPTIARMPGLSLFLPSARRLRAEIDAEVKQLAATLGLEKHLHKRPSQLSGGQRQRVALGRAMVRRPSLFLMDEPLSNLDADRRTQMRTELAALHQRLGITFVYVTHDQVEAMTLSDRVAVMSAGEMLQIGSPAEVYDSPTDIRVAQMVGTPRINILSASSDRDGLLYVGGTLLSTARFASNATFKVGVRPQSAYLAPVGSDRSLAVRILRREDLGGDIYLYLELAATGEAFAVRVERRTADGARDGAHAAVVIDGDHLHVFDDAGRRVSSRLTGLLGSKSAHA